MPVKSIIEFIKTLNKIPNDEDFCYYYRGHSSFKFDLIPSIYRGNYVIHEDKIFKDIILKTPADFANEKTTLEKLVKMQHYGIPTRLLDITSNPLVALYFACQPNTTKDKLNDDGEVMVFKIPKSETKYYDSDTVSIISNLARRPINFDISNNKTTIKLFNRQGPIPYLLHEIKDEKPQFLPIIEPTDIKRVLTVKVKLNNSRIVKQSGAFFLFGINDKKSIPAKVPKQWILNKSFANFNLRISNSQKKKILKELIALAINESTLFPELQNQAQYVKEQYS